MDAVKTFLSWSLILTFCASELQCGVVYNEATTQSLKNIQSVSTIVESRKKKEEDLMSKILPMMVMPFMTQTMLLPMMLMSMKFTLLHSMFLGKLAILFGLVTYLKNYLKNPGGLFSHNVNVQSSHHHDLSSQNYGYEGHNFMKNSDLNKHKKKRKKRGI